MGKWIIFRGKMIHLSLENVLFSQIIYSKSVQKNWLTMLWRSPAATAIPQVCHSLSYRVLSPTFNQCAQVAQFLRGEWNGKEKMTPARRELRLPPLLSEASSSCAWALPALAPPKPALPLLSSATRTSIRLRSSAHVSVECWDGLRFGGFWGRISGGTSCLP